MNKDFVESKILRLCLQPRTFEFISKHLDGLDPNSVVEILASLEKESKVHNNGDLWTINKATKSLTLLDVIPQEPELYLKKYMGYFDFLKTPHPLDFEWRNSTASLDYLIEQVQDLNTVNDNILFLGMPTLFATACLKDIPQKITLVDRNKPVIKRLSKLNNNKEQFKIIEADIFKVMPSKVGNFHCVIMDPPWYSEYFFQFMWLATQCVEVGGIVGISLPPINTRPNIDQERIDWFSFCQTQGLYLENLYMHKLQYVMPFFEFNAFRAAGIKDISPFWRHGDFALFRKIRSNIYERPRFKENKSEWIEKEIDGVRIRVKAENTNNTEEGLSIQNLVKNDILKTVSTRSELREKANIWTSGNRIYNVNNPKQFVDLLDDMKNSKLKNNEIKLVKDFISLVTELETKEYNNYLNWLYYELEREID